MLAARWLRFGRIAAIAAFVAWLISEPFASTANAYGIRVRDVQFTLGSAFGPISYGLFGGIVCAVLATYFSLERMDRAQALRRGGVAFCAGATWVAGADALSDLVSIQIVRMRVPTFEIELGISLLWHVVVASGLALAASLSSGRSIARAKRMAAGGLATGVLSFVWSITGVIIFAQMDLSRISDLQHSFVPYSLGRLADHVMIAFLLGTLVASSESIFVDAFLRWTTSSGEDKEQPLLGTMNRIGSSPEVEIAVLGDDSLAPAHAAVRFDQGAYYLLAGDSAAGTWMGGERVSKVELMDSDTFLLGTTTFEFVQHRTPVRADDPPTINRTTHRLTDAFQTDFLLDFGSNRVGRRIGSVSIPYDETVGPTHASIDIDDEGALLVPFGATSVNDEVITVPTHLKHGDVLTFGQSSFTYSASPK